LLHIIMNEPKFAGPCKDQLEVPALEEPLEAALLDLLAQGPKQ